MLPWAGLLGLGNSCVGADGRLSEACAGAAFFFDSLKSAKVPRVGIFLLLRPDWIFLDFDLRRWMVLPLFSGVKEVEVSERMAINVNNSMAHH